MTSLSRWICAIASSAALASCATAHGGRGDTAPHQAADGEPYRLVWSDEFDGEGPVDPAHWGFENGFVRNQELQWYQPANATRRGGILVIEGRREHKPNPRYVAPSADAASSAVPANRRGWANRELIEYTSSSINTRGKHAWLYGRFEMRAKIDVRTGSWPAFWTLGTCGPWPANGEVDIMEYYDDTLLFNVAWGGASGAVWNSTKVRRDRMPADWAERYHVWRMDWDERYIRLYLDDTLMTTQDLTATINAPHIAARPNPFHEPAYILVNQAMGGQHGGDPAKSALPLRYEVDYVRVYQTASQVEATAKALSP
ncbi:MAG: glycoside hydrolase family 16 protein [bacterium]